MFNVDEVIPFFYMAFDSKPFPSIPHIIHELFLFANGYGYLEEYCFQIGSYMPRSDRIMAAIAAQVEYNSFLNHYYVKNEYLDYKKYGVFREQVGRDKIDSIRKMREECEIYSASELGVILFQTEQNYISKREFSREEKIKQRAILLLCKYDWARKGKVLSEKRFKEIEEYFGIKDLLLFSESRPEISLRN